MSVTLYQIDAFADRPFAGNPAAVCLLDRPRSAEWMQSVAAEMNLSETAFVLRESERAGAPARFRLCWFTPTVEVNLCGHATLAAAHTLWLSGRLPESAPAIFETRSGTLTCTKDGTWIAMDFPADPPVAVEDAPFVDAADAPPAKVLRARMEQALKAPVRAVRAVSFAWLVEMVSAADVITLDPDLPALAALPRGSAIVTAAAVEGDVDFVSRFFAPGIGIPEDPVTGSAHCALAPYWGARFKKDELKGMQVSARGGLVRMTLRGDRVILAGQAQAVLKAELFV